MTKLALVVAVSLVTFLGITKVSAQAPQDCKGSIAQAEPMVTAMKDEKLKADAMKDLSMAKDMMAKNDEQGCMTHMRNLRQRLETNRPQDR